MLKALCPLSYYIIYIPVEEVLLLLSLIIKKKKEVK